ncbi:uncharacterized protein LOC125236174 [Leguminivora glycinivorella]|uniref:uncharacterized protein LOC125236174 n=1 Tax=Leguminivora glycinivorella TaxID=1035111 RepID=UPI00200D60A8|nr:uncharacterized protein LOC125236174 [Leguminivora glycinivorella]
MEEETLITLVREHGELYDPAHRQYQDQKRRDLSWAVIASRLRMQPQECKEKWKKLRENYKKAIKLRQQQKDKGVKKFKPIKHGHLMTFLEDPKDVEYEEIDSKSAVYSKKSETYVTEQIQVDPLVVEGNYDTVHENMPRNDTVVTFFTNLGETVKTFPKDVQIRVKREIFKIINDAEEEVLMNKMSW